MKITIDGRDYNLPASLSAISLAQKIEYDQKHGKDLRAQLKKISDIKEGIAKEIEFNDYHFQLACKSLSFFAGIDLEVVYNTAIEDVLIIYHKAMQGYAEDVDFAAKEFDLKNEFVWNDEIWMVAAPALKHDSKMTYGEFLDAKQWVKNLYELGEDKYEALLMLCCVYFRKKDEPYTKELSNDGGDRYQLLKSLPLEYALHVGFFLSSSMNSCIQIFHSLGQAEKEEADQN
jgi:hypothetical protein